MNASIAGLIMITGVCDDISVYFALIIGLFSGVVYLSSSQIFEKYQIDDPVESAQIHSVCGFLGLLNVSIFGETNGIMNGNVNAFKQIGIQLIGAVSLAIWAGACSYLFFKTLHSLNRLRVSKFYEIVGIDIVMHTMSDLIGQTDDFDRDSRIQIIHS